MYYTLESFKGAVDNIQPLDVRRCNQMSVKVKVTRPVEVGCRGYAGTSTQRLLRSLGITGSKLRTALKELAEEAEQGSFWLWLRRKDKAWGKGGS